MDLATANQMRLMEAQAKNLEADTKKKEVEAKKIAGADTDNTVADTEVKKATARIQQVAANVANETQEDQIKAITYAANEQVEKARERFNIAQALPGTPLLSFIIRLLITVVPVAFQFLPPELFILIIKYRIK